MLGEIYEVLGELYSITGQINKTIEAAEKLRVIAKEINSELFEMEYLLKIAFVKFYLNKLQEALYLFNQIFRLANNKNDKYKEYEVVSLYLLAFLNSCLGLENEAFDFAELSENKATDVFLTKWNTINEDYRLFFLGKTYKNLENIEKNLQ